MSVGRIEIKSEAIELEPAGHLGPAGPVEGALVGGLPTVLVDGLLGIAEHGSLDHVGSGLRGICGNRIDGFVERFCLLLRCFLGQHGCICNRVRFLLFAFRECGQRKQEKTREQQKDDAGSGFAHVQVPLSEPNAYIIPAHA